jgi:glycosyltransferase involved in cell wall biosynthesis
MHVLMVTNTVAPDVVGGLERYVRDLSAKLVARGVTTRVLAKQMHGLPTREVGEDGVEILRYRVPPKSDPFFALRYPLVAIRTVLSESSPKHRRVIHVHFAVPGAVLAFTRRPYLSTFHAPVYRELLSERQKSYFLPRAVQPLAVGGLRAAEKLLVRRARRIVVLSDFIRRELEELDSDAAQRAVLLPGGIDRDRFVPGSVPHDPWADEGQPLLFCARRLTPRTGVPQLLEAMRDVLKALPRARLVIAGDGDMAGALDETIARLGLEPSVRRLGRIRDDEIVDWYRRSDLVVLPTQELEGFGLATAEALACGTPVLGTPVGATPELLSSLDQDLISADASPEALAAGIVHLARDPRRLSAIGAKARGATVAFGWDRIVDRYLELYEDLGRET